MNYFSPGSVTAVISILALLAGLFGQPVIALILADPATTAAILQVVGLFGSLVAGFLPGVKATPVVETPVEAPTEIE